MNKKPAIKNKVIIISPLGYTGHAHYDYPLCEFLTKLGVDVELYTSDKWILDSFPNTFKMIRIYKRCSGKIPMVIKGLYYLCASVKVFFHVLRSCTKIIHFQIVEIPIVDLCLIALLKILGKKIFYTPHDIVHNKKFPLNKLFTSFLYTLSDRIIVLKDVNKHTLVQNFGVRQEKIRVVPHGNLEPFINSTVTRSSARNSLGFTEEQKILLFFGNLKTGKGLDVLLRAMPLIIKKHKNIKLLIAGRPVGEITIEWLLTKIKEEDISDNIILKPEFIPEKDVVYYYMIPDLIIVPYTEISESGVLRFAQTCGKAVVCSDIEELRDTVIHGVTGYLFNKGDYIDLAKQIIAALSDTTIELVGENAKRLMKEQYNWDKIAVLTKHAYDEIM